MRKQPNKKTIGLYLIIGFATLILILFQAVFSKFWSNDTYLAVMYFDESIKGLNVGSSVVFNGVEIGKVAKIELVGDPENLTFRIPVYARVKPMVEFGKMTFWEKTFNRHRTVRTLIQKGLRARLQTQSLLTGQLLIELSMKPDAPLNLVNNPDEDDDILEIPTILSQTGELSREFEKISFKDSLQKLEHILTILDQEIPVLIPSLSKSAQNVEKMTAQISPMTTDTLKNANIALDSISDAMRSLRNFAEYIERYPESILKGKK